jgi:hypothetical protein
MKMSDEFLRNKVKELSHAWKESKEPHYIQEVIDIAKRIENGKAQSFLEILNALAAAFTN